MPLNITTLNPADRKNANVDLSNGNLTVTGVDFPPNQWVRSTLPRTGKVYFEWTVALVANNVIGISRLGAMTFPGFDFNSFGLFSNGTVALNNTFTNITVPYGNGNIVACAVDLITQQVWFRNASTTGLWNGASVNNPTTGIGGFSFAGYTGTTDNYAIVSGDAGYQITVNFGASAFAGIVPDGYVAWNGADLDFPSSPTNGQVYFRNNQPPIYVYNSTKGAWLRGRGTADPRNKITNPTMQISQQNGYTSGATAGYYPADQWTTAFNPTAGTPETISSGRQSFNSPRGSTNRIQIGTIGYSP